MVRKPAYWLALLLLMVALPVSAAAQDKDKDKKEKKPLTGTPVFWRAPENIEQRNLLLGAGGEEMKPDISRLTFIEQKTGGFSTKYRVKDAKGNEWIATVRHGGESPVVGSGLRDRNRLPGSEGKDRRQG
jgi:hypothetical protein